MTKNNWYLILLILMLNTAIWPSSLIGVVNKNQLIHPDDSASHHGGYTPSWNLNILHEGKPVETDKPLFDVEVLDNQQIVNSFLASPATLDAVLKKYLQKDNFSGILEFILLNHKRDQWIIQEHEDAYKTSEEEVILQFQNNQQADYTIELSPVPQDYYFFYIEKSGGLDSIRDVRERLDKVIEGQHAFLAYFNNRVASDSLEIMRFYNELFTTTTQQPFPHVELRNVTMALEEFLPYKQEAIHLHMFLYLSESSYYNMNRSFIRPLLEQLETRMGMYAMNVYILTDFEIKDINDSISHINITNPE